MGLRSWMAQNEVATVLLLTAVLLGVNVALLFQGASPSESYDITVRYSELENSYEVQETLHTSVEGPYHVLYRSFEEPVCSTCAIRFVSATCSRGVAYYATGSQIMSLGSQPSPVVQQKIQANEFGCFSEGRYQDETVTMSFVYEVAKNRVEALGYEHSLFSDDHFYINSLTVQGTSGSSEHSDIAGSAWVSTNVLTGDIRTPNTSLTWIIALLLSLFPLGLYILFGRDRAVTVPQYLHTPPTKREAWQVDILYNGVGTIGKNGMSALLLELYMHDAATTKQTGNVFLKKIETTIGKNPPPNEKAAQLLALLKDSEVEPGVYEYKPKKSDVSRIRNIFMGSDVRAFTKTLYSSVGSRSLFGLFVPLFIVATAMPGFESILLNIICSAVIIGLFSIIAPKSVMNRFKDDYYKEYLEWSAFRNTLTDFAQIQKYMKEDRKQWKEWLVYGAALGAADNVIKAAENMKLLSALDVTEVRSVRASHIILASNMSSGSRSGGFGGGGFGGGGGGGR